MKLPKYLALNVVKAILLLGFVLTSTIGISQDDPTMIFEGKIKDQSGKPISGANVEIFRNGKVVHSVKTNANGEFKSYSDYYGYIYKVVVTKGNYTNNTVEINSKDGFHEEDVPLEIKIAVLTNLDLKKDDINYDIIENKPIERYKIGKTGEMAEDVSYNKSRQEEIKAYFKKLKDDEKNKKKKHDAFVKAGDAAYSKKDYGRAIEEWKKAFALIESDELATKINDAEIAYEDELAAKAKETKMKKFIREGDEMVKLLKFENAREKYEAAQRQMPKSKEPKAKLKELQTIIDSQANDKIDKEFKELLARSDIKVSSASYDEAKKLLAEAQKLKPKDKTPAKKIKAIDKLIAENAKKKAEYDKLIAEGNTLFTSKSYDKAKSIFQKASDLQSKEEYPKKKIKEIDKLLADQSKKEKEYKDLMAKANKNFSSKSYADAIDSYKKALKIKPQEKKPQDGIDKSNAALKAIADAKAKAEAEEKARLAAEAKAKAEAEEKARLAAEAKAKAEAEEKARLAAEAKAKAEAEEKARLAAEAKAKAEAEEKARLAAEAKAKAEAEEKARLAAEAKAKAEADEKARLAAEAKAKAEAEEKARLAAEAKAKAEAEEKARLAAEAKAKAEAEEKARLAAEAIAKANAEEKARLEAEEKARLAAEAKAKAEADEKARLAAEAKANADAAERARLAAEAKAKAEADEKARLAAEAKANADAAERARLAAEAKAKAEADEKARLAAEAKANADAAERARLAAEAKAKAEADEKARLAAEAKANADAAERARLAAEAKAKAEADEKARLAAEAKANADAAERARLAAEAKTKAEADEKARLAAEAKANADAAEKARLAAEAKANADAAEKARLVAIAQANAEAEADKLAREKAEADRIAKENAEAIKRKNEKRNKRYADFISRADEQLKNKNYKGAKNNYNSASAILPSKRYPKRKIEEINEILSKQSKEERNSVTTVDDYFNIDAELYGSEVDMASQDGSFLLTKIEDNSAMREYMEFKRYIDSSATAKGFADENDKKLALLTYKEFEAIQDKISKEQGINDYGRHGSITSFELFLNAYTEQKNEFKTANTGKNQSNYESIIKLTDKFANKDIAGYKRQTAIGDEYNKYSDKMNTLAKAKNFDHLKTNTEVFEKMEEFKEKTYAEFTEDDKRFRENDDDLNNVKEKLYSKKLELEEKESLSRKEQVDYFEETQEILAKKNEEAAAKIGSHNKDYVEYAEKVLEVKKEINQKADEKMEMHTDELALLEEKRIEQARKSDKTNTDNTEKFNELTEKLVDEQQNLIDKNKDNSLKTSEKMTELEEKRSTHKSDANKDELSLIFPQGVTQRVYEKKNNFGEVIEITVRRIVVRGNKGDDYIQRKSKAGSFFFKNGVSISEQTWDLETSGKIVNK